LKEDPKFIYNILADVGKASNMIQEHTARMEQYLTPEERFTQAVLQDNRPVLEQMKNEGFTPSSRLLESVAANHPTADNLETLHSTFGISLVIKIVGEYGGIAPFDGDVVSVHGLIHHKQVGICHGIFGG
jgi:hypothetical protein